MLIATDWPDVVVAYAPVVQTVGGAVVGSAATYFGSRSLWARERQERERQAVRDRLEREAAERATRAEQAATRLISAFDDMRVSALSAAAKGNIASRYQVTSSYGKEWLDARADASDKAIALRFTARSAKVRDAVDYASEQLDKDRPIEAARLDLEAIGRAIEDEIDAMRAS